MAASANKRGTGASAIPATYEFGWTELTPTFTSADDAQCLEIHDALTQQGSRAETVSALLKRSFVLPDDEFEPQRLSIVDRAAALFCVAHRFGKWPARFVDQCTHCSGANELLVSREEFQYQPASAYLLYSGGACIMQPNGYHEARLEHGSALEIDSCVLEGRLSEAEVGWKLLDEAAPQYRAALSYNCSQCDSPNEFWFDPIHWIVRHAREVFEEIHRLAWAYGWSEEEVLSLPKSRRHAYISLIEAQA